MANSINWAEDISVLNRHTQWWQPQPNAQGQIDAVVRLLPNPTIGQRSTRCIKVHELVLPDRSIIEPCDDDSDSPSCWSQSQCMLCAFALRLWSSCDSQAVNLGWQLRKMTWTIGNVMVINDTADAANDHQVTLWARPQHVSAPNTWPHSCCDVIWGRNLRLHAVTTLAGTQVWSLSIASQPHAISDRDHILSQCHDVHTVAVPRLTPQQLKHAMTMIELGL